MKPLKYITASLLFIILFVASIGLSKYRDILYINEAIDSKGWNQHIISEHTKYDTTIGEFYKEVIYNDQEEILYDYRVRKNLRTDETYISTIPFDKNNTSIEDSDLPYQFSVK